MPGANRRAKLLKNLKRGSSRTPRAFTNGSSSGASPRLGVSPWAAASLPALVSEAVSTAVVCAVASAGFSSVAVSVASL